ncbi:MAG: acyltransferase family protein [Propioniciclava sp.]
MTNLSTFTLQFTLDGTVFPYLPSWNASAWTLKYELIAYIGCLVVFSVPWCRRHVALVSGAALVLLAAFDMVAPLAGITTDMFLNSAHLGSYFAAGMMAYGLRDRIPVRWSLFAIAVIVVIALYVIPGGDKVAHVPVAYACLAGGALLPTRVGVRNDISYGVYIYAWPVQTIFAMVGLQGVVHLLATVVATTMIAFASWKLVEQPAMDGARSLIAWVRRPLRSAGATPTSSVQGIGPTRARF